MYRPISRSKIPEPPLEPPDSSLYLTAACGHEVYEGETLVYWQNTKGGCTSLCPDCFWDKIKSLTIQEAAQQFGCDYTTIERGEQNGQDGLSM